MPSFFEQLRRAQPSVKRGIALSFAGIFLFLILVAWLAVAPYSNSGSGDTTVTSPLDAFKGLFTLTKEGSKDVSKPFQDIQEQFTTSPPSASTTSATSTSATSTDLRIATSSPAVDVATTTNR